MSRHNFRGDIPSPRYHFPRKGDHITSNVNVSLLGDPWKGDLLSLRDVNHLCSDLSNLPFLHFVQTIQPNTFSLSNLIIAESGLLGLPRTSMVQTLVITPTICPALTPIAQDESAPKRYEKSRRLEITRKLLLAT